MISYCAQLALKLALTTAYSENTTQVMNTITLSIWFSQSGSSENPAWIACLREVYSQQRTSGQLFISNEIKLTIIFTTACRLNLDKLVSTLHFASPTSLAP